VKLIYAVTLWTLGFTAYLFVVFYLLAPWSSGNFVTERQQDQQRPGLASLGTPTNEYDELLDKIKKTSSPQRLK